MCVTISIHALREEGDYTDVQKFLKRLNFYPRPPRGGRPNTSTSTSGSITISIHALREEGDIFGLGNICAGVISIHALREEGDVRRAQCQ